MKGLLFLWQEKHICDICCDPLDTCFAKKKVLHANLKQRIFDRFNVEDENDEGAGY